MRNSNRKLFLSLELTSYMQAADGLKRTDSPAEHSALSEIVSPVLLFFFITTQRTLPTKTRHNLLTISLTIRYLYYLLYNTSLIDNSYTTFTLCLFFFNYTPMYLANYNAEQVST